MAIAAIAMYASAERSSAETIEFEYVSSALPTTTTSAAEGDDEVAIDPSEFGTEPSPGLITTTLFELLTDQGAEPQQAVCAGDVLISRVSEQELLDLGIAEFSPEAVEPVVQAARDCGIEESIIEATVEAGLG